LGSSPLCNPGGTVRGIIVTATIRRLSTPPQRTKTNWKSSSGVPRLSASVLDAARLPAAAYAAPLGKPRTQVNLRKHRLPVVCQTCACCHPYSSRSIALLSPQLVASVGGLKQSTPLRLTAEGTAPSLYLKRKSRNGKTVNSARMQVWRFKPMHMEDNVCNSCSCSAIQNVLPKDTRRLNSGLSAVGMCPFPPSFPSCRCSITAVLATLTV
jgi:hypothetical protein